MQHITYHLSSISVVLKRVCLLLPTIVFLSACATKGDSIDMPESPIINSAINTGLTAAPVNIGDVFVYDNPPVRWEVTHIGDAYLNWHNGQKGFKKTSWSTVLPALRWSSGGTAGNREITVISGQLHPLKKGNKIVFMERTVRSRPGDSFVGKWECEVQEKQQIVVKAGKSDTWPVLCFIDGRERVLYNYAENIGGVVRIIVAEDNGTKSMRQLTGYARGALSEEAQQ